MKCFVEALDLNLRHAFKIARGSSSYANNVVIRLRDGSHEGVGEAAPTRFYGQTQATTRRALQRMAARLDGRDAFEIEDIIADLQRRFPGEMSAIGAVDIALHDLIGKRTGLPLWKYFGLDGNNTPRTSFTIGIDTIAKVAIKVSEAKAYPILKIKVGVANDLEILREVRRLEPKKILRVDANCGWSVRETIAKAPQLEKIGVEFIEQPIQAGDNGALKRIKNRIGIPIITDESSLNPNDIPALRGCVDGINIKLVKCGGMREALKMIHVARACELKIMIGCMIESSVLITAAAHLSPLVDYADLDGNLLVSNDPFAGVTLDKKARLVLPNRPGLGIRETSKKK